MNFDYTRSNRPDAPGLVASSRVPPTSKELLADEDRDRGSGRDGLRVRCVPRGVRQSRRYCSTSGRMSCRPSRPPGSQFAGMARSGASPSAQRRMSRQSGRVDIAIILVKSFHTRAAAESIRPIVDESTIIATLQNGIGNARILARDLRPSAGRAGRDRRERHQPRRPASSTILATRRRTSAHWPATLSHPPSDWRRCYASWLRRTGNADHRDRDLEEARRRCFDAARSRVARNGVRTADAAA